ncbi:CatB-related O-acetyltransferase [Methylopila musalis]|uniref:CatB-related O-acetyltransferase n=1 Tax=Methylopila musalis TaxID=1134781 RepID=A0ABW3Z2Z9_9HYPH
MTKIITDGSGVVAELSSVGLKCANAPKPPKRMMLEAPVHLNNLSARHTISIGTYSYFGAECDVRSASIGRSCSVGKRVSIAQSEHPTDHMTTYPISFNANLYFLSDPYFSSVAINRRPSSSETATVGHDVWIGEGAFIRSGVEIGHGAIIAAHAVVVKDVPPYSIVAGCPARIIRLRFSQDIVSHLLAIEWWNYDVSLLSSVMDRPSEFVRKFKSSDMKILNVRTYDVRRIEKGAFSISAVG